ncbi:MAG TPA: hypothetical protein VM325_11320 [Alphaproteobacteria bacterium]|nr:hypothetical protein [Alphaproteobacteria bacterium]
MNSRRQRRQLGLYRPNYPLPLIGFADADFFPGFVSPIYGNDDQRFLPVYDDSDIVFGFNSISLDEEYQITAPSKGIRYDPLFLDDKMRFGFGFSRNLIKVAPRENLKKLLNAVVRSLRIDPIVYLDIIDFFDPDEELFDQALINAAAYLKEEGVNQTDAWAKVESLRFSFKSKKRASDHKEGYENEFGQTFDNSIDFVHILSSYVDDIDKFEDVDSLLLYTYLHLFDDYLVDLMYLVVDKEKGHYGRVDIFGGVAAPFLATPVRDSLGSDGQNVRRINLPDSLIEALSATVMPKIVNLDKAYPVVPGFAGMRLVPAA